MKKLLFILTATLLFFTSCSENYSNGERIGMITQFSKSGLIWKSWEGHLNLTQTGMNSSSMVPFEFSIDNDNEPTNIISTLDSAVGINNLFKQDLTGVHKLVFAHDAANTFYKMVKEIGFNLNIKI